MHAVRSARAGARTVGEGHLALPVPLVLHPLACRAQRRSASIVDKPPQPLALDRAASLSAASAPRSHLSIIVLGPGCAAELSRLAVRTNRKAHRDRPPSTSPVPCVNSFTSIGEYPSCGAEVLAVCGGLEGRASGGGTAAATVVFALVGVLEHAPPVQQALLPLPLVRVARRPRHLAGAVLHAAPQHPRVHVPVLVAHHALAAHLVVRPLPLVRVSDHPQEPACRPRPARRRLVGSKPPTMWSPLWVRAADAPAAGVRRVPRWAARLRLTMAVLVVGDEPSSE